MSFVFMLGMAGSGKSTLTAEFGNWLIERGEKVARVNLDPGVIKLPYTPDWDIRKIIDLRRIMITEGLGPNGGLIRAHELMMKYLDKIALQIKALSLRASYIIVDTPGQMELFAFREISPALLSALSTPSSLGVFIMDATNIKRASDVVMSMLLALAINFHLDIETVFIVNKIDLVDHDIIIGYFQELFNDPNSFFEHIKREGGGILSEMAFKITESLREFLPPSRVVAVSAKKKENFYELFSIIHDVFCGCGDLT